MDMTKRLPLRKIRERSLDEEIEYTRAKIVYNEEIKLELEYKLQEAAKYLRKLILLRRHRENNKQQENNDAIPNQ